MQEKNSDRFSIIFLYHASSAPIVAALDIIPSIRYDTVKYIFIWRNHPWQNRNTKS